MFFRLFFCSRVISVKGPFGFHHIIVPYIKRLEEYIAFIYLNFMIIKKLWVSRHAFCYIMNEGDFYIDLYFKRQGVMDEID